MKDITVNEWRASCYTIIAIAQVSTIARVWIRYHTKRLWWDDCWACSAMLALTLKELALIPQGIPRTMVMWLGMVFFNVSLWMSRTSIMLSIVRLIPPLFVLRRVSVYAAGCFVAAGVGMLIANIYLTASTSNETKTHELAIGELIIDLAGDITLVSIPLLLLYRTTLSKNKRRMLVFMFGISLLISVISIIRVVFWVNNWHVMNTVKLIATVEAGTALVVANLVVLTPSFYRRFIKDKGESNSKCTHYQSVQANGEVRVRRVSDLVASVVVPQVDLTASMSSPGVHFQNPEPKPETGGDSDDNPPRGEVENLETPKPEHSEV